MGAALGRMEAALGVCMKYRTYVYEGVVQELSPRKDLGLGVIGRCCHVSTDSSETEPRQLRQGALKVTHGEADDVGRRQGRCRRLKTDEPRATTALSHACGSESWAVSLGL